MRVFGARLSQQGPSRTPFPQGGQRSAVAKEGVGRITRWLRLLRAHGLIRKVSTTSYYRVTLVGQNLMTTALKLRDLNIAALAA
jgi:hypothetical protein